MVVCTHLHVSTQRHNVCEHACACAHTKMSVATNVHKQVCELEETAGLWREDILSVCVCVGTSPGLRIVTR